MLSKFQAILKYNNKPNILIIKVDFIIHLFLWHTMSHGNFTSQKHDKTPTICPYKSPTFFISFFFFLGFNGNQMDNLCTEPKRKIEKSKIIRDPICYSDSGPKESCSKPNYVTFRCMS